MTMHFFLLSGPLSTERLSWMDECLKFFFVQLYPETLVHRGKTENPVFLFFITGMPYTASRTPRPCSSGR
jgi:tRNA 2-thiouridine synthesizing protein C